jgi:hypothetical protein
MITELCKFCFRTVTKKDSDIIDSQKMRPKGKGLINTKLKGRIVLLFIQYQ